MYVIIPVINIYKHINKGIKSKKKLIKNYWWCLQTLSHKTENDDLWKNYLSKYSISWYLIERPAKSSKNSLLIFYERLIAIDFYS